MLVFLCLGLIKLSLLGALSLQPPSATKNRADFSPLHLPTVRKAVAAAEKNATKGESKNQKKDTSISEEMARLQAKRQELKKKQENLQDLEKKVDKKIEKLKKMQANIQKMLDEAKTVKNEKIKHLVDVYSNMQPKRAAQALETLNQDIAVKILAGMRGRTAGEILSFVKSDRAAKLSEELTELQIPFEN